MAASGSSLGPRLSEGRFPVGNDRGLSGPREDGGKSQTLVISKLRPPQHCSWHGRSASRPSFVCVGSRPWLDESVCNPHSVCRRSAFPRQNFVWRAAASTSRCPLTSEAASYICPIISLSRPQIRRVYPLNLSILLSGGKETNKDSLSNGE